MSSVEIVSGTVNTVNAYPPQVLWRRSSREIDEDTILQPAMDAIGGIEHLTIADHHNAHVLLVGIPADLAKGLLDGTAMPGEPSGALRFHDNPPHSGAGQNDVGPSQLVIDVRDWPVKNVAEERGQNLFGHFLRR
ncbi:hypothetical protein MBOT_36960 [Mycobacterium botniense]|uniref:Uncharacterized protein n=1 Tax=Mycobacterium botniense TaxID=84962 RepID=A0A7I9Y2N9_9MYCO|nr:hypothetical protein MBOT_36960 [Mycobacterium botniense]